MCALKASSYIFILHYFNLIRHTQMLLISVTASYFLNVTTLEVFKFILINVITYICSSTGCSAVLVLGVDLYLYEQVEITSCREFNVNTCVTFLFFSYGFKSENHENLVQFSIQNTKNCKNCNLSSYKLKMCIRDRFTHDVFRN